ncbi:MAG: ROK family protein [Clostridia bacterium]|nr:ROK family protein [Clostridia bacterium]
MTKYVAGVDIGGTSVKFGVFEDGRNLIYKTSRPSVIGDPDGMVDLIASMVDESPCRVGMMGVGTPGTVLLPQNLVSASNLHWHNAPLCAMLNRKLKIPIWVDNDAQTQLAAEWWDGACRGLQSAVYLTFGTGVGGGFLFNGKPWRGHLNTAGELGHFITHADGLQCACGLKGCFEMYASAGALCRLGKRDNAQVIIDAARAGDAEMMAVFRKYLHEVAIGVASIYMLFAPEAIVLGGGISAAGDILLHTLNEELQSIAPHMAAAISNILCLAVHRNDAGIRGAAALALTNL